MGDNIELLVAEIRAMREQLIRMDERMKIVQDHETRIRDLEKARWPLPSAALVLALIGLIIPFIIH